MKSLLIGIPITLLLAFIIYIFFNLILGLFVIAVGLGLIYGIGEAAIMIWEKWRGK